jgi:hypothetical protein
MRIEINHENTSVRFSGWRIPLTNQYVGIFVVCPNGEEMRPVHYFGIDPRLRGAIVNAVVGEAEKYRQK